MTNVTVIQSSSYKIAGFNSLEWFLMCLPFWLYIMIFDSMHEYLIAGIIQFFVAQLYRKISSFEEDLLNVLQNNNEIPNYMDGVFNTYFKIEK